MKGQLSLRFTGADYQHDRDGRRLTGQYLRVFELMMDGRWRTLREISELTNDPEASVSAQLRHMRKKRFGSHEVNKKHRGNGLYAYQLIINTEQLPLEEAV